MIRLKETPTSSQKGARPPRDYRPATRHTTLGLDLRMPETTQVRSPFQAPSNWRVPRAPVECEFQLVTLPVTLGSKTTHCDPRRSDCLIIKESRRIGTYFHTNRVFTQSARCATIR